MSEGTLPIYFIKYRPDSLQFCKNETQNKSVVSLAHKRLRSSIELLLAGIQSNIFLMKETLISILDMTAWRMDAPKLFGGFHIAAALITAAAAVCMAALFAGRVRAADKPFEKLVRILMITGWVLVVLEVYKQLFLYYIVNSGTYDWWFFPFQLCSVPMYLCILLPVMAPPAQRTFMAFMGGYTFVSAVATLIYPEDILRSYTALTLHGFIWHGLLLFISLLILITGRTDPSARGLRKAAVLFAIMCVFAVMINVVAEPVMQNTPGLAHSYAAMFYLNPYHISPQPVVSAIQKAAGIPAGLLLYALAIIAVSSLVIRLRPSPPEPL